MVQELQKQIDTLEKDMFKKDIEHKNGERSAGNRLIDLAEESAPQLFEALAGLFAAYQKNPLQQPKPHLHLHKPNKLIKVRSYHLMC